MKCGKCRCSNTKENPVTKAPDPYSSEVNEDETEVWECKKCRQESADEV